MVIRSHRQVEDVGPSRLSLKNYLWARKRNVTSHAPTITSPATMSEVRWNVRGRIPDISWTLRPVARRMMRPENKKSVATKRSLFGRSERHGADTMIIACRSAMHPLPAPIEVTPIASAPFLEIDSPLPASMCASARPR